MTALRLHLRTSPARWTWPPLLVLTLAILWSHPREWVGSWPETGAATQVPAFFLSVAAAAVAAWTSGSAARNRLDDQAAAAAVPAAVAEAYRLAATAILLFIPYAVVGVVAFALTARTFPPGMGLWIGYVLMGVLVMLLAMGWGWVLGRIFNPAYSALTALLSWFVFQAFPGETADLGVVSGPTWKEPDAGALLLRFAAIAVFLLVIVWIRQWSMRWPALAIPVIAAAGVAVVTTTTAGVSDRRVPQEPLCVAGTIEICLWPEDAKYVSMVRGLERRASALPAFWRLPGQLHEYGLVRQQEGSVSQPAGDFTFPDGSRWGLATGMSHAIIKRTLESCDWDAIRKAEDFGPEALRKWLEFYLAGSSAPEYRTSPLSEDMLQAWSAAARTFDTLPVRAQHDWTRKQLDRVKGDYCARPGRRT